MEPQEFQIILCSNLVNSLINKQSLAQIVATRYQDKDAVSKNLEENVLS